MINKETYFLENLNPLNNSEKEPDLTSASMDAAVRTIAGSARSMGVEVEGTAPDGLIWQLGVREDGEALLTVGPGEKVLRRGNLRGGDSRSNREGIHRERDTCTVE